MDALTDFAKKAVDELEALVREFKRFDKIVDGKVSVSGGAKTNSPAGQVDHVVITVALSPKVPVEKLKIELEPESKKDVDFGRQANESFDDFAGGLQ